MANKKKTIKRNNLLQLILSLIVLVLLNIIAHYIFTRFDLTSEKRYTLSPATKKYLKEIDDIVYFKVYLEGDFPAGFKRLRSETREMLDEFRAYSDKIQYKFINPSEAKDKKAVKNLQQQLIEKGLEPTNVQVKTADGEKQQLIFPGAIVSYKGKELPLQLLMNQQGTHADLVLNNSIQGLEYNLINVIRKLIVKTKPRIAFLEGQGELDNARMADIMYTLSDYYSVERVKIDGKISSLMTRGSDEKPLLNKYEALIIANPDSLFNEKDKYFIDQYLMHGGKILWLIDPVFASMDSLKVHNETYGFGRDLNLDDMFFKYGFRINTNLLLDMNALPIPVVTGQYGGQPQQEFLPWYYFPLIMPMNNHPVVNNLNLIKFEFVSSIDTVGKSDLKKTVLLTTSKYSRKISTPTRIALDILYSKPNEKQFSDAYINVALLLEGSFESLFKGRLPLEITDDRENFDYLEKSPETKMIVISDGDVIKNQLHYSKGYPMPLGYDQYTNQTYGNKDLILNCIDYLCDDSGIISIRSRELRMRMLDKAKLAKHKTRLQIINTLVPVLLVVLFAVIWLLIRYYRFTKRHQKQNQ